jgi:hypothetical protein
MLPTPVELSAYLALGVAAVMIVMFLVVAGMWVQDSTDDQHGSKAFFCFLIATSHFFSAAVIWNLLP